MLSALALLATACTADIRPETDPGTGGSGAALVPVSLRVTLENGEAATRAATYTNLTKEGAVVTLTMLTAGGTGYYANRYHTPYTLTDGRWVTTPPIYVDNRTADQVIACYDPNTKTAFEATGTQTPIAVSKYNEDLLWYYDNTHRSINSTNAALDIKLKCAYSRLSLKLSRAESYMGDCKITRVRIASADGSLITAATVDMTDGTLTNATAHGYTIDFTGTPLANDGLAVNAPDESVDLLFPAQTLTAGLVVALKVDGFDVQTSVPPAKFSDSALKQGVHYSLHIGFAAVEVKVEQVTVEDWTLTNLSDNYTPEL